MPPLEQFDMYQWAVLIPKVGVDRYNETIRGEPREVQVRWIAGRVELADSEGTPLTFDALVISGERFPTGTLMWLGDLEDWYGTGSGSASEIGESQLHEVHLSRVTPDLKARNTHYHHGLLFYKETLPSESA